MRNTRRPSTPLTAVLLLLVSLVALPASASVRSSTLWSPDGWIAWFQDLVIALMPTPEEPTALFDRAGLDIDPDGTPSANGAEDPVMLPTGPDLAVPASSENGAP